MRPPFLLTRRALVVALSALGGAAAAQAPLRPRTRPVREAVAVARPSVRPVARPDTAALVRAADLGGQVGWALADTRGHLLDQGGAALTLPPASVTKAVTALFALEALGPDHRFATRLLATGPLADGRLSGDLILIGGADPVLTTDDLTSLVQRLRALGLREITGAFRVWGGALPWIAEIEPGQQDHLGYNPAISGLSLNFNRVHLGWEPAGGDWRLTLDARTDLVAPPVRLIRAELSPREAPAFAWSAEADGGERWSVARAALEGAGSRWLPVRHPPLYAGDVLRAVAASEGIDLPAPVEIAPESAPPDGVELVRHDSPPLTEIARDMLKFSTNLTAEILGLSASRAAGARPESLAASGAVMTRWAEASFGIRASFRDHSGLNIDNAISPAAMVRVLARARGLQPILKDIVLIDPSGEPLANPPASVQAKTGTLNFVSTLAGYVTPPGGAPMAFAIFAANPERRAEAQAAGEESLDGAGPWNARAKVMQSAILARWGRIFGA